MATFGDAEFLAFLSGKSFSEDCDFRYRLKPPRQDRLAYLQAFCAGKRVLHVGCCDHLPLLEQKLASGRWAHGLLSKASAGCLGVDIDAAAVAQVRRRTGMDNIVAGDVTRPGLDRILAQSWDVALFADVLEHIGDPVAFLTGFARNYGSVAPDILVTVPNARRLRNLVDSFRQRERINSDHRCDFTPYTLSKILFDGGFQVQDVTVTTIGRPGAVKYTLLGLFPLLGDTLAAFARLRPAAQPAT